MQRRLKYTVWSCYNSLWIVYLVEKSTHLYGTLQDVRQTHPEQPIGVHTLGLQLVGGFWQGFTQKNSRTDVLKQEQPECIWVQACSLNRKNISQISLISSACAKCKQSIFECDGRVLRDIINTKSDLIINNLHAQTDITHCWIKIGKWLDTYSVCRINAKEEVSYLCPWGRISVCK